MGRLSGLDALRGIAALGVMAMHVDGQFALGLGLGKLALGVDLFFMMSGYVMARTYETGLAKRTLTVRRFMGIRWRRLWLTLAIGTLIGVPVAVLRHPLDIDFFVALALGLAMLPAFGTALPLFAFNVPAWSIFYELVGNLVHGLALARASTRSMLVLVAIIAVTLPTMTYGELWPVGSERSMFLTTFLRFFLSYLIGIALFRSFRDQPPKDLLPIPVFALAVIAAVFLPPVLCVMIAFPAMILSALAMKTAHWADWSGQFSYPLYATHLPVIELVRVAGGGAALASGMALAVGGLLVLVLEHPRRRSAAPRVPAF